MSVFRCCGNGGRFFCLNQWYGIHNFGEQTAVGFVIGIQTHHYVLRRLVSYLYPTNDGAFIQVKKGSSEVDVLGIGVIEPRTEKRSLLEGKQIGLFEFHFEILSGSKQPGVEYFHTTQTVVDGVIGFGGQ